MAADQGPEIKVNRRTYTVIWDDLFVPGQSARSWGVFCYLMSRPPGWVARANHLQTVFREGRDAIGAAMQECVEHGQMTKETYFEGNLRRQRYVLDEDAMNDNPRVRSRRSARETESQSPENPAPDAPAPETPAPEGPPLVSTEGVTTEVATTEVKHTAAAGAPTGRLIATVVASTGTVGQEVDLFGTVPPAPVAQPEPTFVDFWAKYPKRVDKGHAETAWGQMIRKGAKPADILAGLDRFNEKLDRAPVDPKYIPYPATWLRGKRYEDSDEQMAASVHLPAHVAERHAMHQSWLAAAERLDAQTERRWAAGESA